jgi:type VI secretion system secreted protein Hcp
MRSTSTSPNPLLLAIGLASLLLVSAVPAQAADTVHLTLTLDGEIILGESTLVGLGREKTIECMLFRSGFRTAGPTAPVEGGTITIRKRIDRSSPQLLAGLVKRQEAAGVFRFYRPTSDGSTEQFFTVTVAGGYVSAVRQLLPDTLDPQSTNSPPLEEITFRFASIVVDYASVGVETHGAWEGKI